MNGDPLLGLFMQIRKCAPSGSRSCGHADSSECLAAIDGLFCRAFGVAVANDALMDDAHAIIATLRDKLTLWIGDSDHGTDN